MTSYSRLNQSGVSNRRWTTIVKALSALLCIVWVVSCMRVSSTASYRALEQQNASPPPMPAKDLAIVTIVSDPEVDLSKVSMADKQSYADKHGYTFIADPPSVPSRRIAWSKFVSAIRAFDAGYEWVWLLDLDTVITNQEIQIHRLTQFVQQSPANYSMIVAQDCNDINAGSLFLRNTQWSRDFLLVANNTWGTPEVPEDHVYQEQQAILHLYKNNETIKAHTLMAPQWAINNYDHDCSARKWQPGDFMVHFAGVVRNEAYHNFYLDFAQRAKGMVDLFAGYDTNTWLIVIRAWWAQKNIQV
ncbi:hypothetical protein RI367_008397 [Sorochytrium milnesiophthora]